MKTLRLIAITLLLAILSLSCGDDNPVDTQDPGDLQEGTWPEPPTPSSPNEELPFTSPATVDVRVAAKHFAPRAIPEQFFHAWEFQYCEPETIHSPSEAGSTSDRLVLVENGELVWFSYYGQLSEEGEKIPMFEELGTFGGHYYYLSLYPNSFMYVLMNSGLAPGAWVVAIESSEENEFLLSQLPCEKSPFILGYNNLNQCETWRWHETWEEAQWSNFTSPSEPDDDDGYTLMNYYGCDGKWVGRNTTSWSDPASMYYYILESSEALPTDRTIALFTDSGTHLVEWEDRISTRPYIQRELFWEKIAQSVVYPGGRYSEEESYMRGSSEENTEEFSETVSATIEAGLPSNTLRASLSTELQETFSRSISIYTEHTTTRGFEAEGPADGKKRLAVVWQKAERFVVVDENGDPWQDPAVLIYPILMKNRLQSFSVKTTDFDM